jgi:hypothetical protein
VFCVVVPGGSRLCTVGLLIASGAYPGVAAAFSVFAFPEVT